MAENGEIKHGKYPAGCILTAYGPVLHKAPPEEQMRIIRDHNLPYTMTAEGPVIAPRHDLD